MLVFKIDNKEFENEFLEFVKMQKKTVEDVAIDALKKLMASNENKKSTLIYTIKDPLKHLHKSQIKFDESMCDEVALTHIQDSASYIHNMRRQRNT
jgi:hypothetical protein